jgi:hypothetical protein
MVPKADVQCTLLDIQRVTQDGFAYQREPMVFGLILLLLWIYGGVFGLALRRMPGAAPFFLVSGLFSSAPI